MPVIIKYVVERNGSEKMTFTSKADADAYDRLLETAEAIEELLESSNQVNDSQIRENLAMYLAEQKEPLLEALGAKRKSKASKPKDAKKPVESRKAGTTTEAKDTYSVMEDEEPVEDLVIEPDDSLTHDVTEDIYDTSEDEAA